VVLMLFLIGLELEPRRLWSLRRPIFGWGSAQVLGCAALLFAVAGVAAGAPWRTRWWRRWAWRCRPPPSPAGDGRAQPAAHQQRPGRLLDPAVPGRRRHPDPGAAALLGVADAPGGARAGWLQAGKIVGVIAGIILGGRLLLRPLLRWIAKSRTPEIFTAGALLLVVAIAALMQLVGLSMALGAFLAGVLLAESEYRRELETDIEPFKGLLLGLFFMAVGMSIDFGVLMRSPGTMALIVLALLVLKGAGDLVHRQAHGHSADGAAGVHRAAGAGRRVRLRGVPGRGRRARVPAETASLLIGAVAVSMLVSPLLLVAVDAAAAALQARGKRTLPEISEPQDAPVIIAGFGRYGQIVGRLLNAQGFKATVLDHDADMIEAARSFGYKVFYGDATRLDLLRTAGAERPRCWWWRWTTRSSRCASSTWRASTSRTSNWWCARAT
jgi:glutathione-regulated potassium-efflux system ancillary protein KefC